MLQPHGGTLAVKTKAHYNMVRKKPLQLSHSGRKLSKVLPGSVVGSLAHGEIYNTLVARPPG